MRESLKLMIGLGAVVAGAGFLVLQTGTFAHTLNRGNGFPLDDPWIHLQFARNLHEHFSFSYFQDQEATSGSTSPLYTFLLAFGMIFTSDEFMLSYVFGGLCLVLATLSMFRISERLFGGRLLSSLAVAALVASDPRLVWISLSGMETTLFIAISLGVFLFYLEERPVLLGLGAGLLVWCRPEGLLLIGVLGMDACYRWFIVKENQPSTGGDSSGRGTWLLSSLLIALAMVAAYAAFNLLLSASLFPNTLAAKLRYYSVGGERFPRQVFWFVTTEHMTTIAPFLVVGVLTALLALLKRRRTMLLIPLAWSIGMILAYWWKLPYLYQYGRYLMPILPFVFLLAVAGVEEVGSIAGAMVKPLRSERVKTLFTATVLLVMVGITAGNTWERREYYASTCRYITERQVATAFWIRDHLPKDVVVATHDVGALAYYSGRRIVDMVGLISPEMIDYIGRLDKLLEYLRRQKVTHLAVLRSWFDITNVHPLFLTDELKPEVMEVFEFDPEKMHFTDSTASILSEQGRLDLASGDVKRARALLERAVAYDANSARIHLLLGRALMLVGRLDDADREFARALALQADLWDARFGQADVSARRKKPREAIAKLERLVHDNPAYSAGYQALAQLYDRTRIDTAKAAYYRRKFNESVAPAVQEPR